MKTSIPLVLLRTLPLAAITAASLLADSQLTPGAGNQRAAEIVRSSEMVKSAHRFVIQQSEQLSGANRLPAFRKIGSVDLLSAGQMNLLAEMTIHNLSDADWVHGDQAVGNMQVVLTELAPEFGVDPSNTAVFNNSFRNVVFAHYPVESIYITYTRKGKAGVKAMISKLVEAGVLAQ